MLLVKDIEYFKDTDKKDFYFTKYTAVKVKQE